MIEFFSTGHVDDVLLGKPRACAGRGIRTVSTRYSAVVGSASGTKKLAVLYL